ncbi:MAG TPA: toll/interleukin-1 receptor domain-containing protein, partial [Longimicrobium sp.]|nr:toll/interleukin-1 receptor domain-containing protein [Longimicrobium sp.]
MSSHQGRDQVFISYSREDVKWLNRLSVFLKPYVRQGLSIWSDRHVRVGDEWRREIDAALDRAAVGVLLVSPEFLASDFIMDVELPALTEAAENGLLTLVCVPVSESPYRATRLTEYQWARSPDDPLDRLRGPERNTALVEIVSRVVEVAAGRVETPAPATAFVERRLGGPVVVETEARPGQLHGVP